MSRTIIVAGCLGGSTRSICRRRRRDPVLLDHRAIVDASDEDGARGSQRTTDRRSFLEDPWRRISRRCLASILSASCCSSNSKRCDSDSAGCRRCRLFPFPLVLFSLLIPPYHHVCAKITRVAVRKKNNAPGHSLSRIKYIREANSFGELRSR